MTLDKFINSLPRVKQLRLAVELLKNALPIWDNFAQEKILEYTDSIVGLKHTVKKDMIINSLSVIEKYLNSGENGIIDEIVSLKKEFTEPVVALQDDDWNLPQTVLLTFYSAYNLINAISEKDSITFGPSSVSVSINQSIDALEKSKTLTPEQIKDILQSAI